MNRSLDYRQGDVGFVRGSIPQSAKRIPFQPFALGESTGHSHCVIAEAEALCEMYQDDNGTIWVRALGNLPVRHEDHDPSAATSIIPQGWEGEIRGCGEYDEEQDFRRVVD